MLRRFILRGATHTPSPQTSSTSPSSYLCYAVRLCSGVSGATREAITKSLTSLKEESKGQSLDLGDMSDAMKMVSRSLQECSTKHKVEDVKVKAKMATLAASLKAYNSRLANMQNEARSLQGDVDALLKLMWGTDSPSPASFSTPPPPPSTPTPAEEVAKAAPVAEAETFEVDPPILSKILDEKPAVEQVEGEKVMNGGGKSQDASASATEEIEVESIEVEVEQPEDAVDSMAVTDITKELFEHGVSFSDCLDAQSLRTRYKEYLGGMHKPKEAASPHTAPLETNTQQPRMPPRTQDYQQQQQQYNQGAPNTSESGVAHDPYPNAHRKMVDPMRTVWEIKQELASEKGIDVNSVDLWSGKTKLEDKKRLYDYPSIQSYPIEVRQKGDVPQ